MRLFFLRSMTLYIIMKHPSRIRNRLTGTVSYRKKCENIKMAGFVLSYSVYGLKSKKDNIVLTEDFSGKRTVSFYHQ
jgi:hypothetical protein